jgi:thiamine transport system substrate-binding protein
LVVRNPHILKRIAGLFIGLALVAGGLWLLVGRPSTPAGSHDTLRVMTYSSFMNGWGPGPEIAKRFQEETGLTVEFQDAGDAGLILEKLKLFSVDVVLGLDGLSLDQARERLAWRNEFEAIDWAPLAFVYREGEIEPPRTLDDLLDTRFNGAIALEDPRTSTPGLQFLLWVLETHGEENGFKFLARLKPNLHSVSPSWSTAYGAFTAKQVKLVLSYATSPIYHLTEEKNAGYKSASFTEGQPVQTEYAGIPANCVRCEEAETFVRFLLKKETQALIMNKNFMMPVVKEAAEGTPFAQIANVSELKLEHARDFLKRRTELFEKWRKLGL